MKNIDFTKVGLWTCVVLMVCGGLAHWYLKSRVEQARKDSIVALNTLGAISTANQDIDVLEREMNNDKLITDSEGDVRRYITNRARDEGKMDAPVIGEARPSPSRDGGYTDTSWELSWNKRGSGSRTTPRFTREQIAAFLWGIENRSQRLKVTSIRLDFDRRAVESDLWQAEVTVTERRPNIKEE